MTDNTIYKKESSCEMMDKILAKAWKSISLRGYENRKVKQLLTARLLSRGFSWNEVSGKIDDFMTRVVQSELQKK